MMFWLIVVLACWWGLFGAVALTATADWFSKALAGTTCIATVYVLVSYAMVLR